MNTPNRNASNYNEETKKSIGQAIRHFRATNAMTQEKLAEKIGTSVTNIMRWENGYTKPNLLSTKALRELGIVF